MATERPGGGRFNLWLELVAETDAPPTQAMDAWGGRRASRHWRFSDRPHLNVALTCSSLGNVIIAKDRKTSLSEFPSVNIAHPKERGTQTGSEEVFASDTSYNNPVEAVVVS